MFGLAEDGKVNSDGLPNPLQLAVVAPLADSYDPRIPADFNLNQFFDFPGENSPGAFGCSPPTINAVETWQNGPEVDPAPLIAEVTGRGAVPVWFLAKSEMETAMSDGVVTIGEQARG